MDASPLIKVLRSTAPNPLHLMSDYDQSIAMHYEAYRPPLHSYICEQLLGERRFSRGLDIGSGTGRSTEALVPFCDSVIGLEPSEDMLARVGDLDSVEWRQGTMESNNLSPKSFDVLTFAGSIGYCDMANAEAELVRLCAPGATILVYDFEVKIEPILASLSVGIINNEPYDHDANIDEFPQFALELLERTAIALEVTAQQLAHLLLSSAERNRALAEKGLTADTLPQALSQSSVEVDLYMRRYRGPV